MSHYGGRGLEAQEFWAIIHGICISRCWVIRGSLALYSFSVIHGVPQDADQADQASNFGVPMKSRSKQPNRWRDLQKKNVAWGWVKTFKTVFNGNEIRKPHAAKLTRQH